MDAGKRSRYLKKLKEINDERFEFVKDGANVPQFLQNKTNKLLVLLGKILLDLDRNLSSEP
ncbi:unnamed protein product [marine sediment metagenome]|uniref:Uncharacterized protein n=1 Tax=marine sediment metagenome TaxID=412755 RepID=X1MFJ7_9ZZZZ